MVSTFAPIVIDFLELSARNKLCYALCKTGRIPAMKDDVTLPDLDFKQLKRLRTALAVCQGTRLLQILQQEAESTITHDQSKRVTFLTELFSRIHRELFHHWKEQATVNHRPGWMSDPGKRKEFRKAIAQLVLDGNNHGTAIFDNNGFVIRFDNIAERLANFYDTMRKIRPFRYGNRITLDLFMAVLGKLPAFKSVYEQGIDFRRLGWEDAVALENGNSAFEDVVDAFIHALDPNRCKSLNNKPNSYGVWPENRRFLSGIPFLSHIAEDGIECLVTVNGGLVPVENIPDDLFNSGKHFADYPLVTVDQIIGYLPGTENIRAAFKLDLDGIALGKTGEAPLFCLDINILSGLRAPSHADLMELVKQCTGEKASIFALINDPSLRQKLLDAAEGDERAQRGVEIACERLVKINAILLAARDAIFKGKIPVADPKLFMCMGGAGAGKSAVEEFAKALCGDNFVVASLDEFRKQSELYCVLTAAKHHSDDYVFVEPFANRLRDLVAEHARNHKFNLLYDGTSIPYRPRYSTIVEQFHAAGFYTHIIAVDAFLVKPAGREEELLRSSVIGSVKSRYEETDRALPWVVTIYKHIRSPEEFLKALEHEALNKISLFANDGERNKHYLVAESFDVSDTVIESLQACQLNGSLLPELTALCRSHSHSTLNNLANGSQQALDGLMARNPSWRENNAGYQIYPGKNTNRILLIYNVCRMTDFIEKRQLNPNASGEEGLLHKCDALAFHIDPLARVPWLIRLQGSQIAGAPAGYG